MKLKETGNPTHSGRRASIGGVEFDLIGARAVVQAIRGWKTSARREYISLVNPHSIMMCRRDEEMKIAVARSALTLPDGIGVVLGAAILSYEHSGRLSGPEVMLAVCDEGRRYGLSHYFYGGAEGVAPNLAAKLQERFPGLNVAGYYTPPFRKLTEEEDAAVIRTINSKKPDILWVGLGAPKQEKWMAEHRDRIEAPAMIGVGAAFDFHSENKAWCPAILRRAGLEWAYRLACEPARLWRRNLDSPLFLATVARQALAQKRGASELESPQ
jgi:N-acetylglucosaminyldiphosphoundecaprenol N-acetyl-beta-D-mannosaminyltransferase